MKRIDLVQVQHNVKIGDKCPYIEPNITEDSIFYLDGEPIGFYMTKMPEKMCKLADLADKEFNSNNVKKKFDLIFNVEINPFFYYFKGTKYLKVNNFNDFFFV